MKCLRSWLAAAAAGLLLPMLAGCLDRDSIAVIADAENQLFTPDGRLVVTGGTGVFEVVAAAGGGYAARPIAAEVSGSCNHTGLAQIGAWIFTACVQRRPFQSADHHLLAARAVAGQPLHFVQVDRASADPMDALALPNGLAATPDGRLLVADYRLPGTAGVARVALDLTGERPRITAFERDWLAAAHGIGHPNGVRVQGRELFVSDFSFVKRYLFDDRAEVPLFLTMPGGVTVKNEVLVFQGATAVDDIEPFCGGVVVTDFIGGRLVYMAPDGLDARGLPKYREARSTPWQALHAPSSVKLGRAPLFDGHDVLITEKGLLGEFTSDYGNRLSRVKAGTDLSDPAACDRLNAR